SDKSIGSTFIVPKMWGGWGKVVHGGLQTVLMDEVSGWTVITLLQEPCLTINVELQFFSPLYVEEEVEIVGEIAEIKEKDIIVKSYIRNKDGEICTQGIFTFRKVTKEKIEQIAKIKFS
ncbi:MAG: hotdog fold domain-containing protein, partial [Candidatus Heimdallarchaeaceae archaeon]